jgi:1-aminocyclopropane-1-carboxylate deaminase
LYAKREDRNSGLAFGGNKVRKLEYIVPDAIASGADTLVTISSVQSNHTRQVAAKINMKCRLVQESWAPF